MALIECVPNVSVGKNQKDVDTLIAIIKSVDNAHLLHVDRGISANRTVFTIVGKPEAILEVGFKIYQTAQELIDMRYHKGTHPRIGAVDVFPLIPLQGATMNEAIDLGVRLANKIEEELNIASYYYAYSALWPDRQKLEDVRRGEYEGLIAKQKDFPVDIGPTDNLKTFGATIIGVRKILGAFNINLETKDVSIAKTIAEIVRESGSKTRGPGILKSVKAIGWYIEDFDKVQVSCNLTDIEVNGLLDVYLEIKKQAEILGTTVTGSELIGLTPKSEIEKAGSYFKQNDDDLISAGIDGLGLREVDPFNPAERILENAIDLALFN